MKDTTQWTRGALAMTLAILAFLAVGCGGQERARTSGSAGSAQDVVAASASLPEAAPVAVDAGQAGRRRERIASISNDSLPPDVVASVTDSLATPGTIIEITAMGSPDVEEVLLSDGLGNPQRFAYDPMGDLWRASYRVPVRVTGDRLGLAVTARNELNRWRRVWVFVGVQREAAKEPATAIVDEK